MRCLVLFLLSLLSVGGLHAQSMAETLQKSNAFYSTAKTLDMEIVSQLFEAGNRRKPLQEIRSRFVREGNNYSLEAGNHVTVVDSGTMAVIDHESKTILVGRSGENGMNVFIGLEDMTKSLELYSKAYKVRSSESDLIYRFVPKANAIATHDSSDIRISTSDYQILDITLYVSPKEENYNGVVVTRTGPMVMLLRYANVRRNENVVKNLKTLDDFLENGSFSEAQPQYANYRLINTFYSSAP